MLDERVRSVLHRLELESDAEDASAPVGERSLQIAPTSGAVLFALCAGRERCRVLEIGGSRGYSTIWLAAAARLREGTVTSLEAEPAKLAASARNLAEAGLDRFVEVIPGDAFVSLERLGGRFDLVFLDAWKDDYERYFERVRPLLAPGAVVVADNVVSHRETLGAYSAARQADPGLVSVTVPLDSGLEITSVLTAPLLSG